jgi:hypothetical protein
MRCQEIFENADSHSATAGAGGWTQAVMWSKAFILSIQSQCVVPEWDAQDYPHAMRERLILLGGNGSDNSVAFGHGLGRNWGKEI